MAAPSTGSPVVVDVGLRYGSGVTRIEVSPSILQAVADLGYGLSRTLANVTLCGETPPDEQDGYVSRTYSRRDDCRPSLGTPRGRKVNSIGAAPRQRHESPPRLSGRSTPAQQTRQVSTRRHARCTRLPLQDSAIVQPVAPTEPRRSQPTQPAGTDRPPRSQNPSRRW